MVAAMALAAARGGGAAVTVATAVNAPRMIVSVTDCVFTGNVATQNIGGSGLQVMFDAPWQYPGDIANTRVELRNTSFVNNTASACGCHPCLL